MENLWPTFPVNNPMNTWDEVVSVLEKQRAGIGDRTSGLVLGRLKDRSAESSRSIVLQLFPRGISEQSSDFLTVRSADGGFPAVIETYHLPGKYRLVRVDGLKSLSEALKKIFVQEKTREIVEVLLNEAQFRSDQFEPNERSEELGGHLPEPAIAIGRPIAIDSRIVCQLSLLGVSGFVDVELVKKLAAPSTNRVERLHNHYVVTLRFQDNVKVKITEQQLHQLRVEARAATSF